MTGPADPTDFGTGWGLAQGYSYNITQAVHDVPNADEMMAVVQSLRTRNHQNVITAQNKTAPTEWIVNYDSFPMPAAATIQRGQQSKMGPYTTSVLDVRRKGDLQGYFNGAVNA